MKKFYLYCVVFLGGAAVLALEILGTRILGPFYGVSLFLWSVLITITMLSLSIGYLLGGKWADKYPAYSLLNAIIAVAGIWIIIIPWIKHPILTVVEPLGLRPAVFIATLLLFSPPLTLLGMISPLAIKLRVLSLDNVGKTAGNLYSLSTLASVISALVIGSFFIPYVGVSRLTIIIGLTLITLALVGYSFDKKLKIAMSLFPAVFVSVWGINEPPYESPSPERGLLAIQQSAYAELRVIDSDDTRNLFIDGGLHSSINPMTAKTNFPYASLMDLPRYFYTRRGKMLLIGLGAGSLAKNYADDGWKVDAIEIDPVVVSLAKQYFSFREDEATVYTMDGRHFLNSSVEKYDVILLDAFGSSSIPFHLITTEVFQLMKAHLNKSGILSINLQALGWQDIIVRSVATTLRASFANVIALPIAEPPTKFGNIVLLAADSSFTLQREIVRDYQNPDFRFSSNYWKVHGWDNRFEPSAAGINVLTDDLNPIDLWSEDINFADRKELHAYLSNKNLSW